MSGQSATAGGLKSEKAPFISDVALINRIRPLYEEALRDGVITATADGESRASKRWYAPLIRFDWANRREQGSTKWTSVLTLHEGKWTPLLVRSLGQTIAGTSGPCTEGELARLNAIMKKANKPTFNLRTEDPYIEFAQYVNPKDVAQTKDGVAVLKDGKLDVIPGAQTNSIVQLAELLDLIFEHECIFAREENLISRKGFKRAPIYRRFWGDRAGTGRSGQPKPNPSTLIKPQMESLGGAAAAAVPQAQRPLTAQFFDKSRPVIVEVNGVKKTQFEPLLVRFNEKGEDGHTETPNNANLHRAIRQSDKVDLLSKWDTLAQSQMGVSMPRTFQVAFVLNADRTRRTATQDDMYGDPDDPLVKAELEAATAAAAARAAQPAQLAAPATPATPTAAPTQPAPAASAAPAAPAAPAASAAPDAQDDGTSEFDDAIFGDAQ